jgi:hypothetical protein
VRRRCLCFSERWTPDDVVGEDGIVGFVEGGCNRETSVTQLRHGAFVKLWKYFVLIATAKTGVVAISYHIIRRHHENRVGPIEPRNHNRY